MTSLLRRLAATFVEPARPDDPPSAAARPDPLLGPATRDEGTAPSSPRAIVFTPPGPIVGPPAPTARPSSPTDGPSTPVAAPSPLTAIVLAADAAAIPLAAACAGELRARAAAAAALLCVWRPPQVAPPPGDLELPWEALDDAPPRPTPSGATTPAARRLAARLTAHELAATACGRLAWLPLEPDATRAVAQARRALAIAGVPVVTAVAGPRTAAFEPLIQELGLTIAVLPADATPALHEPVLASLPAGRRAIRAPMRPGPPRWAAMAGLGRLRSLGEGDP